VAIARAVPQEASFYSRLDSMAAAKADGGQRAACDRGRVFISGRWLYWRITTTYWTLALCGTTRRIRGRRDLFPFIGAARSTPLFNFKSVMARVSRETFDALGLPEGYRLPGACDYYRFVLSRDELAVLAAIAGRDAGVVAGAGARASGHGGRGVYDLGSRRRRC